MEKLWEYFWKVLKIKKKNKFFYPHSEEVTSFLVHFKGCSYHFQLYSKHAWSNLYQFLEGTGLIFLAHSNVINFNFRPEYHMLHLKTWRSLMWFSPASSLICGNKMPTRCNRGFLFQILLNMFRAPLCPSSGAQEYYTVVAACGISCCGFSSSWSGVELRVMRPVCRMLQHPAQNAFLFTVHAIFRHDYPLAVETASTPRPLVQKRNWRKQLRTEELGENWLRRRKATKGL